MVDGRAGRGVLPLISIPAAAQEAVRTIGQYDREASAQYVGVLGKRRSLG